MHHIHATGLWARTGKSWERARVLGDDEAQRLDVSRETSPRAKHGVLRQWVGGTDELACGGSLTECDATIPV